MALLKHGTIKNSSYTDALDYVIFLHNEETGEIVLDRNGNRIMRDEYYLDGINCDPYSFSAECDEINRLYGKNKKPNEIKEHHFIISYDPKDATKCGLTGPKAQELSMEWVRKCLPGFQVLVCTHMDGHNHSGNIHTHLICNSVRMENTGTDTYGERIGDHKAGNKLHLTLDYLEFMKREVMRICEREGLHQVDLFSPAQDHITEAEYYAQKAGQKKLEENNEKMLRRGMNPNRTEFATQKQYLRDAIKDVSRRAESFEDFQQILKDEYGIDVKESRGRWSYLHPNREKYITGRALGAAYEKDAVMNRILHPELTQKAEEISEELTSRYVDFPHIETIEECRRIFVMRTELRLVVNLQECAKAQDNIAYANKVKLSNLKKMAETILFVQQNDFDSITDLEKAYNDVSAKLTDIENEISRTKIELHKVNEQIHYMGQYLANKETYKEMLRSENKADFRAKHRDVINTYELAWRALREHNPDGNFPSISDLKNEKQMLMDKQESLSSDLSKWKTSYNNLNIALENSREILQNVRDRGKYLSSTDEAQL